ncbi:MAG: hypothetical protein GQ537_07515 [Gammaproteobacteria bacterium]|nr:hypothetical protein [Gammaproteobacteria bacterium]
MSMYQLKQSVTEPRHGCVAAGLLRHESPLLSAWYANPLSPDTVAGLQAALQRELQARLCSGMPCFQCHVLQLVCHFQDQVDVSLEFEKLRAAASDMFERALLELVYGQLLMSCKQTGARQHLADGFTLAAGELASIDYFRLVKQHELLAYLPLSDMPSLPQDLESLLAESGVIKQLRDSDCKQYRLPHLDTIG